MRLRADSPTIGLSCGHRVPRSGSAGFGKGYWCGECGTFRLSGGKSSGVVAFDGFFLLADLAEGLTVDFRGRELRPAQLRLLDTLGVTPVNFRARVAA